MATKWREYRRSVLTVAVFPVAVVALGLTVHRGNNLRQPADASVAPQLEMNPQVATVFSHSCADCHSNRTVWPWYSYIPPASWLIERDVANGREHFNESTWAKYSFQKKRELLADIATVVANNEMPLKQYRMLHQTARLSPQDAQALILWASRERRLLHNTSQQILLDSNQKPIKGNN